MVAIRRLEKALAGAVEGEVRFDAGAKAAYAADASNYRQVPIAVVLPRSKRDIEAAVAACRAHDAPLLPRGAGTSQCGQAVNVAVVLDSSKYMHEVVSVDARSQLARVQPGVVCDALQVRAAEHGLTFAPDPATHSRCTLGGMIGNNSCGPHSVMAGKTVENVERLEVLTYDGSRFWCGPTSAEEFRRVLGAGGRQADLYRGLKALADRYADHIRSGFPKIKRRVSGYNLDQLLPENGFNVARALVGSEGTCAVTLEAEVRLVASPRKRVLAVCGFPDIFAAGDAVPGVLACGPIACEGLDDRIIEGLRERGLRLADIGLLPPGRGWLMVEFGADTIEEAAAKAQVFRAKFGGLVLVDPALADRFWTLRETGASATSLNLGGRGADPIVGWEDAAVDPLRLGDYLREFHALVRRFGYRTSLYGHFGDGCIHARIDFDLRTPEGLTKWRKFLEEAARLVVRYGGSLSGEHGDGQARAEFLPLMYGPELMQAFREFKGLWDPLNRMNPGKLVDAMPVDANLRLGPQYKPVTLQTRLAFLSEVGEGFVRATEHCIGMGKCRSASGGTMCPSYRATREERYSTRGRARLLSEMLRGEIITEGWGSADVKEALDWCLACKGCRSDCPTHTDMAAYKAEFLSHYYERRPRPAFAHAMGRIGDWAPLAAKLPRLANALSGSVLARKAAGIAPARPVPRFALRTFRSGFRPSAAGDPVVLLDDTFNNHFRPATAEAAQRVLESAGCAVELPREHLCCGRPYYDYGMLEPAKSTLERMLGVLGPRLEQGVPLVVLEPGCLSVLRDELGQLFPHDPRARRLSESAKSLPELLEQRGAVLPAAGQFLLHGHCHEKALWGTQADTGVLRAGGGEVHVPDAGCCGMAGSFGYRAEFYDASSRIAAQGIVPALAAAPDAQVVTSGFSCREQIEHLTGRRTWHVAEVLARSLLG